MIALHVHNSTSRITGVTVRQLAKLRKKLSYTVVGHNGTEKTKALLDKRGFFPTGLLPRLRWHLGGAGAKYDTLEYRKRPEPLRLFKEPVLAYPPYHEQVTAAMAAGNYERGIIVAPTAFGKSYIVALIAYEVQVKTLIVVPRVKLRKQLIATLQEAFGADKVGRLKDGRAIAVENIDSIDPSLDVKAKYGYDCVIIDEFHHSAAKTYRDANKKAWKGVYFRFGLTATPFRGDDEENMVLEGMLSKVIYRVKYGDAVKRGRVLPVKAYYIELPNQSNPDEDPADDTRTYAQVYSQLVVKNKHRSEAAAKLATLLHDSGVSTMVLVKEVAHGREISELIGCPLATGEDADSDYILDDFVKGVLGAIVATSGIAGEGVDTKPCEWVILAGGGKSKIAFMQAVGRAMRLHGDKECCTVVLFKDPSHKFLRRHYNACVRYLREEYGVKPVKLDLTA